MHELSIALRILDIARRAAEGNGGGRIVGVRMRVGQLTCVDSETLVYAFEIAARGTTADGCRVDITRVPSHLRCACGDEHDRDLLDPCPSCGAPGGEVVRGRELSVESIDVDDAKEVMRKRA
jgi:hydrogenase nickel incorporation protein HypA/HybF